MAITQITNNVILDGTILPAKLNISPALKTFLGDATSANLASAVSGTTGSGNLVFATSPTLTTPTIATINGSTSSNGSITVQGTSNATRTTSNVDLQPSGGGVTIGGTTRNASAILQINSTTLGFLPPVMTSTQRNAISSPASGLVVYSSDLSDLSLYNGTAWGDILTTHSGSFTSDTLATALSDENGSGGGFVRAEGATLSSLGLSSIQQSAIDRIYSNQTVVGSPATAFFDDFLGNTVTDLNWELSFLSPSFSEHPSQSSVNAFGLVRFNTSTGNGSFRGYLLRAYGGTPQGAITEVCFAMPTFSSMSCFAGLTRVNSSASLGVTADTDINSGRWTFLSSGSASSVLITGASLPTGATPRDGDFVIGKKYRVRTEILSVTGANIRILECDATSNSWSTVFDGIIQTPTQDRTLGQGSPLFSVRNKSNQLNRILITDWFSYSNPTFIR